MSERFFSESPILGGHARLEGAEAQHLAKVMRARQGDQIVVFDGSGAEFLAEITALSRHAVDLQIVERREIGRELGRELTLAVALPKGDRQQWLIEKLTELGVTRLVPILCQRSVAQPVESAIARMQRWVIEASKQCGRNRLMEIATPVAWKSFAERDSDAQRWILHPSGTSTASFAGDRPLIAAVGPEGGWTEKEVAVASNAGWQALSLGPRILRVETAAIAIAALASTEY